MAQATKGTGDKATGDKTGEKALPYRVLARKYRPTDFTTLVGQEAMVRTLRNAIATGRIAHAFMLTGVRGVGKLIEGVRYRPVSARYKVYIIDEVHMLSEKAFNALLKTLEEPPPHVKFLFATTEIRKVPVTVLSRCQRFDLKRE